MTKLTPKKQKKLIRNLEERLPNNEYKSKIIDHYRSDDTYLIHIVEALKILLSATPNKILDVKKTTRAGYTTSAILAALFLGKKILVVEPTNEIGEKTVSEAVELYIEITGNDDIKVRPIPSNYKACDEVENNDPDVHMHQFSPKCKECEADVFTPEAGEKQHPVILELNKYYCVVKTMMKEKEDFNDQKLVYEPEIITITYAKMEYLVYESSKNEFFNELIQSREVVLWDEFGAFLLSSSDTGMIHEVTNGEVIKETDITKEIANIMKFIDAHKSEIDGNERGYPKSQELKDFIYDYIVPLEDYYKTLMSYAAPCNHTNPLTSRTVTIKVKGQYEEMPMNEALSRKMPENMIKIQNIDVNEQGREYKKYLASLVTVLTQDTFVLKDDRIKKGTYSDNTNPMDPKIKTIMADRKVITPSNRGLLKMFAQFLFNHPEQSNIVTDATLPNVTLDDLFTKLNLHTTKNKKHVPVIFGDPAKTNEQLLVLHYISKRLKMFFSTTFIENDEYAQDFYKILDNIIAKIDIGNAFIIVPKKEVHEEIADNYKDIAVSSEKLDEEHENKLVITYYGSPMSRGVSCDRRICISLGVAWKPIDAFKAIVLGQGNLYVYADQKLLEFAEKEGMTLKQFKKLIEDFFYPPYKISLENPQKQLNQETVPTKLLKWFEYTYRALSADATAQGTKQGVDRCKDPKGEERSVAIVIGVGEKAVNDFVNWGATTYNEVGEKQFTSKDFKINPCKYIQRSDFSDAEKWLSGEDIQGDTLGYDKDFTTTLHKALIYNHGKSITLAEIWANLMRNLNIHHESPDHFNGYMVGMINILRAQIEGRGIEVRNANNKYKTPYTFYLKKDFKDLEFIEPNAIEVNALKILHSAFNTDKNEYSWRLASNNDLIMLHEEFTEAMDLIHDNDILKGSTWEIKITARNNKVIIKDAINRS